MPKESAICATGIKTVNPIGNSGDLEMKEVSFSKTKYPLKMHNIPNRLKKSVLKKVGLF